MAAEDPRDQLRRYLEQRRDLGESELMLDSLDVDAVLRLLGAAQRGGLPENRPPAAREADVPRPAPPDAPPTRDAGFASGGSADWRAALRATGAAPDAPGRASGPPAPAAPARPHGSPSDAGDGESAAIPPSIGALPSLDAVAAATRGCTRCPLYSTALNAVPGEGNPDADLMIVGEAPGATEDETGRPFIGAAGQLLTKIIEAINLRREDVFIANVLKHRPPGNRNPKPDEVTACSPYLLRQIELVKPKVILALGTFAAQTLLDTKVAIGKLRGEVHQYHGVPLVVTYHPAALLRNPAWKRPTWEDVQLARRVLDRASGA